MTPQSDRSDLAPALVGIGGAMLRATTAVFIILSLSSPVSSSPSDPRPVHHHRGTSPPPFPGTLIYLAGTPVDVGAPVRAFSSLDDHPFTPSAGGPHRRVHMDALVRARRTIRTVTVQFSDSAWDPSGRPLLLGRNDQGAHFLISSGGVVHQVADPGLQAEEGPPVVVLSVQGDEVEASVEPQDNRPVEAEVSQGQGGKARRGAGQLVAAFELPDRQREALLATVRGLVAAVPGLKGAAVTVEDSGRPGEGGGGGGGTDGDVVVEEQPAGSRVASRGGNRPVLVLTSRWLGYLVAEMEGAVKPEETLP